MNYSNPTVPNLQDALKAAPESARSTIDGIAQPILVKYFETLNQGEFLATSQLFAADGILQPPFEQGISGQVAIANYLQQEAKGLILCPLHGTAGTDENGFTEYQVVGQVHTSLFSVNVSWQFTLNPADEITFARVNLLASFQELLKLRQ